MNVARSILALLMLLLTGVAATAQTVSPQQVKAAFIYNFIKFVEWPTNAFVTAQSPYVVGVLGGDPFGETLDATMRGKIINGRPITVRRVSLQQAQQCHVLFITSSDRRRLSSDIQVLGTSPVLTVGEMEGFCQSGGMINFVTDQNKVRFEINDAASKKSGLKIHSTLLSLAKTVRNRAG